MWESTLDGLCERDARFPELAGLNSILAGEQVVEGRENGAVHRLSVRSQRDAYKAKLT